MRYLKKEKDLGPIYFFGNSKILIEYLDSYWVGDLKSKKSTFGYVFTLENTANIVRSGQIVPFFVVK